MKYPAYRLREFTFLLLNKITRIYESNIFFAMQRFHFTYLYRFSFFFTSDNKISIIKLQQAVLLRPRSTRVLLLSPFLPLSHKPPLCTLYFTVLREFLLHDEIPLKKMATLCHRRRLSSANHPVDRAITSSLDS